MIRIIMSITVQTGEYEYGQFPSTFDVEAPELEKAWKEAEKALGRRVVGVEFLPEKKQETPT